jgi:hypothetical protein
MQRFPPSFAVPSTSLMPAYSPQGYNIGWNIGDASGASISHLHMHVVPRYHRELGFIDIIGGAKIIVEDPEVTRDSLRAAFAVHPGCSRFFRRKRAGHRK